MQYERKVTYHLAQPPLLPPRPSLSLLPPPQDLQEPQPVEPPRPNKFMQFRYQAVTIKLLFCTSYRNNTSLMLGYLSSIIWVNFTSHLKNQVVIVNHDSTHIFSHDGGTWHWLPERIRNKFRGGMEWKGVDRLLESCHAALSWKLL